MKKILNRPEAYVDEMLDGMVAAHPESFKRLGDDGRVIARAGGAVPGKVGIVTGGGSGHLPVFLGYVGDGLLDACAVGNVFAGPRVDDCQLRGAQRRLPGAGLLQLYGNYGGDRMNFDMSQEFLQMEGMQVESVRVADDVASAPAAEKAKRRGVAGMVYRVQDRRRTRGRRRIARRIVTAAARKAADACRSIGVALTPCVVPESGKSSFSIDADRDRVRHGDPRRARHLARRDRRRADALAQEMLDNLLPEADIERGSRVAVLVNSLGATPHEELYILYRQCPRRCSPSAARRR